MGAVGGESAHRRVSPVANVIAAGGTADCQQDGTERSGERDAVWARLLWPPVTNLEESAARSAAGFLACDTAAARPTPRS